MLGVELPPTVLILSVDSLIKLGLLAAVTGPGAAEIKAGGFTDPVNAGVNDSRRMRPVPPTAPVAPATPPCDSRVPVPVTCGATNLIAPPLPPPAANAFPPEPPAPLPPLAETLPVDGMVIRVEEAMTMDPPPPPPPAASKVPRTPPPPPEPPNRGSSETKEAGAPYEPFWSVNAPPEPPPPGPAPPVGGVPEVAPEIPPENPPGPPSAWTSRLRLFVPFAPFTSIVPAIVTSPVASIMIGVLAALR